MLREDLGSHSPLLLVSVQLGVQDLFPLWSVQIAQQLADIVLLPPYHLIRVGIRDNSSVVAQAASVIFS